MSEVKVVGFFDGKNYAVVKLPEPDELVSQPDPQWDYKKNPYGPGTIGFEKGQSEISALKNNYLLISHDNLLELQGLNDELSQMMSQARILQRKINDYLMDAYRVTPNGVYSGKIANGESLSSGGKLVDNLSPEEVTEAIEGALEE